MAFGDDLHPLPETVKVLDEIVTEYVLSLSPTATRPLRRRSPGPGHASTPLTQDSFIIETCHAAALCAAYSHRAKIKVDDFKFALRKDPKKLGRVTELLALDKDIKKKRKAFEVEDEVVVREGKRGRGEKDKDKEKEKGK